MVSTRDFESLNLGSNPSKTFFCFIHQSTKIKSFFNNQLEQEIYRSGAAAA